MVVTGASSGIGLAAAVALARAGDRVVLLGRDPERLRRAVAAVRDAGGRTPPAYRADFAELDQVRDVGARIAAEHERVHVLAANAGQLAGVGRPTGDGHDRTMQVNHLAPFLLAHLLLDRMRAAATPAAPGLKPTFPSPFGFTSRFTRLRVDTYGSDTPADSRFEIPNSATSEPALIRASPVAVVRPSDRL